MNTKLGFEEALEQRRGALVHRDDGVVVDDEFGEGGPRRHGEQSVLLLDLKRT